MLSLPWWSSSGTASPNKPFLPQTALTRGLRRAIGKVTNTVPLVDFAGPLHPCSHMRTKTSSLSLILAIAQLLGLLPWTTLRWGGTERTMMCLLNIRDGMYLPHTDFPTIKRITWHYSIFLWFLQHLLYIIASVGTTGLDTVSSPGIRALWCQRWQPFYLCNPSVSYKMLSKYLLKE